MQDDKYVVLCIDDDPDVLEALQLMLEAQGFVAVQAATAEEGIRAYKQANPDIIVCDLMMEEVDSGTNFAREMKLLDNKAPIILLSSVGDAMSMAADYSDFGFAGVLQKPVNPDLLAQTIRAKLKI